MSADATFIEPLKEGWTEHTHAVVTAIKDLHGMRIGDCIQCHRTERTLCRDCDECANCCLCNGRRWRTA